MAVAGMDTHVANGSVDMFPHIRELLEKGESEQALFLAGNELERIRDEVDHEAEAQALLMQALAHADCYPGDSFGTAEIAQSAAEAFRVLGDTSGEWDASRLVVEAHLEARCGEGATQAAQTLLNRCRQLGDNRGGAWSLAALAEAALLDGRTEESGESLKHATKLYREAADTAGEAHCKVIACNLHLAVGEQDEAMEVALKAYELYDQVGDKKGHANASIRLSHVYAAGGQHVEALRAAEEAEKLAFKCGDRKASVEAFLAEVAAKLAICEPRAPTGDNTSQVPLQVLHHASAACAAVMETRKHDPICVGDAHYMQARCLFLMGSLKNAELSVKTAAKAYRKARDVRKRAKALLLWSEVEVKRGYLQDSRIEARRAQELFEQLGDDEGLSKVALVYEQIDKALGIPTQAELEEQQRQAMLAMQQQQQQLLGSMPANLPVMEMPPEQQQGGEMTLHREGGPLILSSSVSSSEIQNRLVTIVKQILGDEGEDVEMDIPLMEAGISSNRAVILRDEITKDIPGIKLPSTLVFDYPSVSDITLFIAEKSGIAAG